MSIRLSSTYCSEFMLDFLDECFQEAPFQSEMDAMPRCDPSPSLSVCHDAFLTRIHLFCAQLSNSPVCSHVLQYFSLLSCGDFESASQLMCTLRYHIDETMYAELVSLLTPSLCGTALVTSLPRHDMTRHHDSSDSEFRSPSTYSTDSRFSPIDFSPLTFSATPTGSPLVPIANHPLASSQSHEDSDYVPDSPSPPPSPTPVRGLPTCPKRGRTPVNRRRASLWTAEEDTMLIRAVESTQGAWKGWKEVAKIVGGGRTADSCSQRWLRCLSPGIKKGVWSADEDQQLRRLVNQFGSKNWKKIARNIVGRTDIQCRYRWQRIANRT
ncbi:hypothetical protein RCL1_001439 [Eukaryota sp. TZLM3-RCL]